MLASVPTLLQFVSAIIVVCVIVADEKKTFAYINLKITDDKLDKCKYFISY